MQTTCLDGRWSLVWLAESPQMPQTPQELAAYAGRRIPAEVPGNVELDLIRAGELPAEEALYQDDRILQLLELEKCQWWYERDFPGEDWFAHPQTELVFEGLDCFATVWVNGQEAGRCANAMIRQVFRIGPLLRGAGETNRLTVRLASAVNSVRDKDFTGCYSHSHNFDGLWMRKPQHCFGKDVCPRVLSAGIWRSVHIRRPASAEITSLYVITRNIESADMAKIGLLAEFATDSPDFDGFSARFTGGCGESTFQAEIGRLVFQQINMPWIAVPQPKLWWPAGYGEQPLYTGLLEILRHGEVVASREVTFGIRTVELDRSETHLPERPGRFRFRVNGQPVFIKGSNWIWTNLFHSRDRALIPDRAELFRQMGCNMLRAHGSNVYEAPELYEFCDRHGILVWQDFGMTGLAYPQISPEFREQMRQEFVWAVKELRQHPCIALWCGDNEADLSRVWRQSATPPSANRITREVLPEVLQALDGSRPYLPSSPYISPEAWQLASERGVTADKTIPETHLYSDGAYYKSPVYREGRYCFSSEIGFAACSATTSLRRFLSPVNLWPWKGNAAWNMHGTEPLPLPAGGVSRSLERIERQNANFFGACPESLEDFVLASQITQAESLKFVVEEHRLRKDACGGLLWWNMFDCWPQSASYSVVDSYLHKKLAFYYLRRVHAPFCILSAEPDDGRIALYASNDSRNAVRGTLDVMRVDKTGLRHTFSFSAGPDELSRIGHLAQPPGQTLLLLKWRTEDGQNGCNHLLCGQPPFSLQEYRDRWLPQIAALSPDFVLDH